jgi:hypothetical protein
MWMSAIRGRLASRGLAALLTLLVCGGAVDWGHAGGDDPDCDPVPVHHDHTAHHFSAQPTQAAPAADHCFICHSLRLLHNGLTTRSARSAADVRTAAVYRPDAIIAIRTLVVPRPSRAPPDVSL